MSAATTVALIASMLTVVAGIVATPALADTSVSASGNTTESFAHDAWSNSTVADNAGHVYIFWENYGSSNTRMFYQVSSDNGKTFAAARSMCSAISGCVQNSASDTGIAGTTDTVEEEPDAFVDTTTTPPTLYVAYAASQSFSNLRPYQIRLLKSTDFGNSFTLVGGFANLGASASTPCSTGSGATVLQCNSVVGAAKGNNIYLSIGEVAVSNTTNAHRRGLLVSTNGGTSWSSPACNTNDGATCVGQNGGILDPNDGYLDSTGNYWTLWVERLGPSNSSTASSDYVYSMSKTTAGSTTTTWGANIYRVVAAPTYPGAQLDANSGTFPESTFTSTAESDINATNGAQYMIIPMKDSNTGSYVAPSTMQANPSQTLLRLARCTSTCTNPSNWSGYNAGDLKAGAESNPRVDDKDAAGACGGTVAGSADKCSVAMATVSVNDSDVVSIQWLDDRLGNTTNCNGAALNTKAWSHTCAVNTYLRTQTGSYNGTNGGFSSASLRVNDHAPSSPVSTSSGFHFPYGDVTTLTPLPGCPTGDSSPATFSAWNEAHTYAGGNPDGGLVYYRNNQTGAASPNVGASGNDANNNVSVTWSSVGGATQYKLYRAVNGYGEDMTLYQTFGGGTTSYNDTSVTNGTEYSYAVGAVTGAGEGCQSAASTAVSGQSKFQLTTAVTPNNDPTSTPTTGSITTNPAPPDLQLKKYTKVSAVAEQFPSRDADSRWRFNGWTVSPSSFNDGTLAANIPVSSSSSAIAAVATSANVQPTQSFTITAGTGTTSGANRTETVTCGSCGAGTNIVVGNQVTIAGVTPTTYNVTAVVISKTATSITVGRGGTSAGTYTSGGSVAIVGASETGTTATINTDAAHNLTTGSAFSVSGVTPSGYNGSWTVASTPLGQQLAQSTAAVLTFSTSPTSGLGNSTVAGTVTAAGSGATESGNIVTLTTTANHSISQGDAITVSGVGVSGYNGSFVAGPGTTGTAVTYTVGGSPDTLAPSGGGTVSINGTQLVVNETDHATEPATPFNIKVDNEQMNVTAVTGAGPYTYTVTRGFNGTTAAPHSSAATVTYPTIRTGCTTSAGSCTLQMQGAITLTANYVKQWAVTTKASGFTCDDALDQVCDVPTDQAVVGESGTNLSNTTFGPGQLVYAGDGFPAVTYVDDAGTLNYRSGYAGQKVTSVQSNGNCGTTGLRGLNVASSTGFNVGDTILVSGAQITTNDANWDGIWTIVAGSGANCLTGAGRIVFQDPAGGNGNASGSSGIYSQGALLFVTNVGNSGQGGNTPTGTNLVLPTYGSNDALPDDSAGYPATFPPDSSKQYRYISTQAGPTGGSLSIVNAFGSLTNVSGPKTIVATYRSQHKVRYDQNGLSGGDTSGTIATVQGFGDGATPQNFTQAQLPTPSTGGTFQDDAQAFNASYTSPVASTNNPSTKRYVAGATTYTGLKGNQSTSSFSSYALVSISAAEYDANDSTETYYCGEDVACPFQVGQTVTISGFTNPLSATLNATITNNATSASVNVANPAATPQLPFFATIDNETVNVSAISGSGPYTYTIARGQNGSTAVSHTSGTAIVYDSNCAGCANYNGDRVITDLDNDAGSFTATAGNTAPGQTDTSNATDPNLYNAQAVNYSIPTSIQQYASQFNTLTVQTNRATLPASTYITGFRANGWYDQSTTLTAPVNPTGTDNDQRTFTGWTGCDSTSGTNNEVCTVTTSTTPNTVTATYASSNQAALTVTSPTDGTFGDKISPTASGGSGTGAVTFTASGSACQMGTGPDDGKLLITSGTGTCSITAHKAADGDYDAVDSAPFSVTVHKANQSITGFSNPGPHTYGDADFAVSANADSGLDVAFSADGDCTVTADGSVVHLTGAGSCTLSADQAGDADWNAAAQESRTFSIATSSNNAITFANPGTHQLGTLDFQVSASATSGLDVNFTSDSPANCTVSGDPNTATVHLIHAGASACTLVAHQPGDDDYDAAPDISRTFDITKADQSIAFSVGDHVYGDPDFSLSASATSGLTVSFSILSGNCSLNGNTLHISGTGNCSVRASQGGNGDYNAAPNEDRTFNIDKASQSINGFTNPGPHTYGDGDFSVSAGATSGLAVTFTAIGDCTVAADGSVVHITGAGSCTITAHQAGDANYNPASDVPQTFSIAKANQSINFASIPARSYGDADFTISPTPTASSGLSVSLISLTNAVCTISGSTIHIVDGGADCTIRASQAGNGNYNAAPNVDQSFAIARRSTTTSIKLGTNTVAHGNNAKFVVKSAGNGKKPVGATVQIKIDGNVVATGTLNAKGKLTVTYDTTPLTVGNHSVQAFLVISSKWAASMSTVKTLKVT